MTEPAIIDRRGRLVTNIFLVLANVAFVAIMLGLVWLFRWSGPGFMAGALAGVATFAVYTRLKMGYWI